MNNTVMTPELEKALANLAARADDHIRYNTANSHDGLKRAVDDPHVSNWLVARRMNGTAPHSSFDKVDEGKRR